MATEVIMPQLGESIVEGTVVTWLKKEGDAVEEFEPLLEVETDKVVSEIPAPGGGTLLKIYVPEGATVEKNTLLAVIGQPGEAIPEGPVVEPAHAVPAPVLMSSPPPAPPPVKRAGNGGPARISPVVARIAAEHNVDVSQVPGTGREGRVTKKDILAYIEEGAPSPPEPALAPWEQPGTGDLFKPTDDLYKPTAPPPDHVHKAPLTLGAPGDLVQLSVMRKRRAEHRVMSKLHTAPHATTVFEADMSAVAAHRRAHKDDFARRGVNLTFTAYFVAAAAHALRAHPMVNSQWTDEGILLKPEVNIGMAVAIDDGLIVPVIKGADELSLPGLARQINDLAARARSGSLLPEEVQGGTFTITNHGVAGSLFATPIINQPQAGILGVGAIKKRVVVLDNDAIAVRPMVYLSLTFDHRGLDGASADWFVAEIVKTLENWPGR